MKTIIFSTLLCLTVSIRPIFAHDITSDHATFTKKEYQRLYHLKKVNPSLYQLYIDTQMQSRDNPMKLNDYLSMMSEISKNNRSTHE